MVTMGFLALTITLYWISLISSSSYVGLIFLWVPLPRASVSWSYSRVGVYTVTFTCFSILLPPPQTQPTKTHRRDKNF